VSTKSKDPKDMKKIKTKKKTPINDKASNPNEVNSVMEFSEMGETKSIPF
jgi:hypothetical protein